MIRCHALAKAQRFRHLKNIYMHVQYIEHLRRSALQFDFHLDHIPRYPVKSFEGCIVVINSQDEEQSSRNADIISRLKDSAVLGFDTETAVFWGSTGHVPSISLIQLACEDACVIWRLRRNRQFLYSDFPQGLRHLLCERSVLKVGCGVPQDVHELYLQYNINSANVGDVQELAAKLGLSRTGLVNLSGQLFGWKVSKQRQKSNWEASTLHESQLKYAATDAWLSLKLYKKIKSMLDTLSLSEPASIQTASEYVLVRELKKDQALLRVLDAKLSDSAEVRSKNQRIVRCKDKWRLDVADIDVSALVGPPANFSSHETDSLAPYVVPDQQKDPPFYFCVDRQSVFT